MKRISKLACSVLIAVAALFVAKCFFSASNEIEYQGQVFKLSRTFYDYEDYKNDPDNVDNSENARIERAVINAPIAASYSSREQLSKAVFEIKFPGYGLSSIGEKAQPDGSVIAAWTIEVPHAAKDRILVFRGVNGKYSLLDDFVFADSPSIMGVREESAKLVYTTLEGNQVVVRPLTKK